MPKPKPDRSTQLTVTLPDTLRHRLKICAAYHDTSANKWICHAIERQVEQEERERKS